MSSPSAFEAIKARIARLLSSPTRRRLARGALWGGVATAGSRGIAVLASFFLARLLGQAGFGEYGMVNSTAGMVGSLAGMGLGLTVTKHVAELRGTDPARAGRVVALSSMVAIASAVVCGAAFVVLSPWLAEKTLAAPHLAPMLQISAITVAFGVLNGVQTGALVGTESFGTNSLVTVSTGVLQTAMVVLGAWRWGLTGAVVALAAGAVLTVVATQCAVSRELGRLGIRRHWREAKREWRVLVGFSLPTFLTMLMIGPGYWACNALLANQPDGYAELGVFNAATQWQGALAFFPGLLGAAMVPVMSERLGSGDVRGSLRVMWRMMGPIALVVVPVSIAVALASPWIMECYGEGFREGRRTLILLCSTAVLSAITFPASQFVVAAGKMWATFAINLASMLVMVCASWCAVGWGAEGLASARLLSAVAYSSLFFLYVRRQRAPIEETGA